MNRQHLIMCMIIDCVIIAAILASGCVNGTTENNRDELPSRQYIAIYEENNNFGTVVDNYYNSTIVKTPSPEVPVPFDLNTSWGARWLSTNNSSLKSVYGYRIYYQDPAYNQSLNVNGIYEYPYTLQSGLTITMVFKNRTIQATYNDLPVTIGAGESWICPDNTTFLATKNLTVGGSDASFKYQPFTLRYNGTWTVTNMGVYSKI